jgi:methionine sulfoxide reductase heme-binding subunit
MTQTQWARRVVKPAVFLVCLVPFAQLVYGAFWGDLGANPVEMITNTTGIWTLRLLVITIAITPVRWLTGFNLLILFRRMLGLFAFFYGSLHFMTFFVLDHSLAFEGLWEDVLKRPYITMGFSAFVLLIPLALTSTQRWIRRLGGHRWNLLHRLVYVSATLAVIHYWWKVKLDTTFPRYYALVVAVLLGLRIWRAIAKRNAAIAHSLRPGAIRSRQDPTHGASRT